MTGMVGAAPAVLVGLALFLWGLSRLSASLRSGSGERTRRLLARYTGTRLTAAATGAAAAASLHSSAATIAVAIALVDARLLPLSAALAVILGANVGTTFSTQAFALDALRLGPFLLAGGGAAALLARRPATRRSGQVVLALGMVFLGLATLSHAVRPLAASPAVTDALARLESPLPGALAGAAVSALMQSSSAVIGLAIVLAGQGLVTLPAGIALMLGAEVGTCTTALAASAGRSRAAVAAGVFQLFFNLTTVAAGLLLVDRLAAAAAALAPGGGVARQIANAHLLFNLTGALVFLLLTPAAARLLERVIARPDLTPEPLPE